MYGRCALLGLVVGCGFNQSLPNDGGATPHPDGGITAEGGQSIIDAAGTIDARADATPDASRCFGTGMVTVCLTADPPATVTTGDLDTTNGCTQVVTQTNGPELCVIAAHALTVPVGRTVPHGSRPLVLLGIDSLAINGQLDVASHRPNQPLAEVIGVGADSAACSTPGAAPDGGNGGSGGGAGGSFGTKGGDGGKGDGNSAGGNAGVKQVPAVARGGCPGSAGGGTGGAIGHGGGAVYLISTGAITIATTGSIIAFGEAGGGATAHDGGGGAGTGGMIGLDAPTITLTGAAYLDANGGGGGEGGGQSTGGFSGSESTATTTTAQGGFGNVNGGDGGNGAFGTTGAVNGHPGSHSAPFDPPPPADGGGGGGGGGGFGVIRVFPAQTFGSNVSPSAT